MLPTKVKDLFLKQNRTGMLMRNATGAFVVKIIAMLIQFIQVPIVLSYLDKESYGVYLTITSIVMWTHNFDLGIGSGLRYKLTESLSSNDNDKSRKLISTAYISLGSIMAIVGVIGFSIIFFLNWQSIFNFTELGNLQLATCVGIVLFFFLMVFVLELITIVLQAAQKSAFSTVFRPIANVIAVVGVLILSHTAEHSLLMACVMLTSPIAIVLLGANIYFFSTRFKRIRPSFHYYAKDTLKDIYSLGGKMFISSIAAMVVFNTSAILITNLLNPTDTAVYNTSYVYYGSILTFASVISTPFIAGITDAFVKKEYNWLKVFRKRFYRLTLFFNLISLLLLFISPIAFKIWLHGKLYIPLSISIVLTIYFILNSWSATFSNFVVGFGKAHISMLLGIFKIITFIPVSILLIKEFGIIGLVLSTIIINTIPNIIFTSIQSTKLLNGTAAGIWNK